MEIPVPAKRPIAQHLITEEQAPVAFYTLETTKKKLVPRFISAMARIDSRRLLTGNLHTEDWPKLTRATGFLLESPLYISDNLFNIDDLIEDLERVHKEKDIKLAFIDFFQLLSLKTNENLTRDAELGAVSRKLKELAKKLDIPIVLLCSLNKQIEKRISRRPLRGDIRDCGAIEYDADIILFLYRDEIYNLSEDNPERGTAEIIVAKGRMGRLGLARTTFIKEFSRFENMSKYEFEDQ